ncbi:MAG: lysophospholipid acyltransferase family protein [Thermoleophilaceae bacterium]
MSWAHGGVARAVREVLLMGVLGPLIDLYTRRRIVGREHLGDLNPPVLFVANHSSHVDTPTILRALPAAWRRRTAVAAAADYFYRVPWLARAVSLAFNTVPVQRKGEGAVPDAASDLARLIDAGWSLLVFAEGTRSRDGTVGRLRSGAAVLAAEHHVPIVPVHVSGTHAVMPPGRKWMRRKRGRFAGGRHPIAVHFGPAVRPSEEKDRIEFMERIRLFFEASGAVTSPDRRVSARRGSASGPPGP